MHNHHIPECYWFQNGVGKLALSGSSRLSYIANSNALPHVYIYIYTRMLKLPACRPFVRRSAPDGPEGSFPYITWIVTKEPSNSWKSHGSEVKYQRAKTLGARDSPIDFVSCAFTIFLGISSLFLESYKMCGIWKTEKLLGGFLEFNLRSCFFFDKIIRFLSSLK